MIKFTGRKPNRSVPRKDIRQLKIVVFFGIIKRKLWYLISLNLLYVIFSLPVLALSFFFVAPFYIQFDPSGTDSLSLRVLFAIAALCLQIVTTGPVQAGFTFVLRNYAREEHAYIWYDFKESAKKNLKQSLIISCVDLVVVIFFGVVIGLYMLLDLGVLSLAFEILLFLFFILFLLMHLYMYPILVTFDLTVKDIYKNAFILSVVQFIPNIMIILLCLFIFAVGFMNNMLGLVLFVLIIPSFTGLVTNFYVYPRLEKYLMR